MTESVYIVGESVVSRGPVSAAGLLDRQFKSEMVKHELSGSGLPNGKGFESSILVTKVLDKIRK